MARIDMIKKYFMIRIQFQILITPEIDESMLWRSRIDPILSFQNLCSLELKHYCHRIVNKTFTVIKICPPSQAMGDIDHFLMDNKICLVIKYFNFAFSSLAFFATIMDGQIVIVKIVYFDTIFISHSRSHA